MLIKEIKSDEDVFSFLERTNRRAAPEFYGQLLAAANRYKDGDATRGLLLTMESPV